MSTIPTSTDLNVLAGTKTLNGEVGALQQADYQFQLKGRSSFQLALTNLSSDANLQLSDRLGNVLATSTNSGALSELINQTLDSGVYTVRVSAAQSSTAYSLSLTGQANQHSDLMWRNASADVSGTWLMNNAAFSTATLTANAPTLGANSDWKMVGTGDWNGDGETDLVLRNDVADQTGFWFLKNNAFQSAVLLDQAPLLGKDASGWKIVGTGDFNNDGNLDLTWQNYAAGEVGVWFLKGTSFESASFFTNAPQLSQNSFNWNVVGTGDFNSDGNSDLVLRNDVTDQTGFWFLKGKTFNSAAVLDQAPALGVDASGWKIVGTGDFNNDSKPELVWQNRAAGQVGVWSLQGTSFQSAQLIENAPALGAGSGGWQVVGTGSRYTDPLTKSVAGSTSQTAFNMGALTGVASYSDRLAANSTGFYQFTLSSPQSVNLAIQNQVGMASVQLLDSNGAIVVNPSQGVAAGTYYVKVMADMTDAQYSLALSGNAPPLVDLNGADAGLNFATTFTEKGGAIAIVSSELMVSDANSTTLSEATVTIANLQDGMAESLTAQVSGTPITASYNAGILSLLGSASVAQYQQVLRSITYNNTSNNPNLTARQVTVRVNDGLSNSAIATSTVQVVAVNDAPFFTNDATLAAIFEEATNPAGASITTLFADKFSDPDANSSLSGVAIYLNEAEPTQGQWQYSLNGATWSDVGAVGGGSGVALSVSTLIRFLPAANFNGTPTGRFWMAAIDNTYTGNFTTDTNRVTVSLNETGGSSPISATGRPINTNVMAVNDAPSFTKGADITVTNTAGAQTVNSWAMQLSKGATDEQGQTLNFTVTTDQQELFEVAPSIDASGKLTYMPKVGATGTAMVSVTLKDDGGTDNGGLDASAAQTFTIIVEPKPSSTISLVVADGAGSVRTLNTSGDGTFTVGANLTVGSAPYDVIASDLNGDGNLDLVTSNLGSNSVSILLGNSDGSFATAVNYTTATAHSTAVGDFNKDNKLDLAVTNLSSTGSLLLGKGDGTFEAAQTFTASGQDYYIVSGDFDLDGNLDVAMTNYSASQVNILLGKGDGTFANPVGYTTDSGPYHITAADFNKDGKLDLATGNYNAGSVSVLLAQGNGTFGSAMSYTTGSNSCGLDQADLNGDGNLDIVVANRGSGDVSVLLGQGNGTFGSAVNYVAGSGTNDVTIADLNKDGKLDLAAANLYSGGAAVLFGLGDGTFGSAVNYLNGVGLTTIIAVELPNLQTVN
jgi:hypothetical protein